MNNFKLDFIGIGAAKCGTTWLAECLKQHPQVFVPYQKEINFFDSTQKKSNYSQGLSWYSKYFNKAKKEKLKGEFTTHYLFYPESASLIKKHFPKIKIIVCLRRPEDMVYSFYWWRKANFLGSAEQDSFEKAIKFDKEFIQRAKYYLQLKKYYDLFPKENIFIILFDNIQSQPLFVIKELFKFLNINTDFCPTLVRTKINKSKTIRYPFLSKTITSIYKFLELSNCDRLVNTIISNKRISKFYTLINKKNFNYPPMNKTTRKDLQKIFYNDILELEKLINKDLTNWKTK